LNAQQSGRLFWVDRFQGFLQSWIDIADKYKLELESAPAGDSQGREEHGEHETIGGEIEDSFREFVKEGREQGSLRSNLSDEVVMAYIRFFQQGIANNPGIHEKMLRDAGFSSDLLSLFMYGVAGSNQFASPV
jgi:hypothetical protein